MNNEELTTNNERAATTIIEGKVTREGLLVGSVCENSKLDIFCKADKNATHVVSYLRLWQSFPNIENLVTSGASWLVNEGINRERESTAGFFTSPPTVTSERAC